MKKTFVLYPMHIVKKHMEQNAYHVSEHSSCHNILVGTGLLCDKTTVLRDTTVGTLHSKIDCMFIIRVSCFGYFILLEKSCKNCYFGGILYNKKHINIQCCKDYISYMFVVVIMKLKNWCSFDGEARGLCK